MRMHNYHMECMVSYIIPVYNCRKHLRACIGSIIESCHQGVIPAEAILIDDGSTDGSGELCDEIANKIELSDESQYCSTAMSCTVIHQPNQGVSSARNVGIHSARGEYVIFIDSDDTVDPKAMADCVNVIVSDPGVDMLIFGMSFDYYHHNRIYRRNIMLPPFTGRMSKQEFLENINAAFDANCLSSLCNKIFKRSLLMGLSLREEMILYEDLEFSLRILLRCESILFKSVPVYHYRHEGDGNIVNRVKRVPDVRSIIDRIDDAMNEYAVDKGHILCAVGNMLFFNKMKEMPLKNMKIIAQQYKEWADSGNFREIDALLYSGNVIQIKIKMMYSKYRHHLASVVKRMLHKLQNR